MFWKRSVTTKATESLFEIMDGLLEKHETIGVLVTVYNGIELPARKAQNAISEGLEARTAALRHGVAIAIEGSGIGATLGRSIARTISLFSRQGYPSKVFPSPVEGLGWLREQGADTSVDGATYRTIRDAVDSPQ